MATVCARAFKFGVGVYLMIIHNVTFWVKFREYYKITTAFFLSFHSACSYCYWIEILWLTAGQLINNDAELHLQVGQQLPVNDSAEAAISTVPEQAPERPSFSHMQVLICVLIFSIFNWFILKFYAFSVLLIVEASESIIWLCLVNETSQK